MALICGMAPGHSVCGGTLCLVLITDHTGRVIYRAPLPYLDSSRHAAAFRMQLRSLRTS